MHGLTYTDGTTDASRAAARADKLAALRKEAAILAAEEFPVAHNSGTYSAAEAHRATGCGDPTFNDYTIYERVGDGRLRVEGCDPDKAPGHKRGSRDSIAQARSRLKKVRAEIKILERA